MATERDLNIIISAIDKASRPIHQIEKAFATVERVTRRYAKEADYLNEKLQKTSKTMDKVGKTMSLYVTTPILGAGAAMIKFASDTSETQNKVQVSFGKSAAVINKWSSNAIKKMGLAGQTAQESAALYGDMATGMGISQDKAANMAMSLTQLGADLASFKNISNDMAQTALKSIFTGETESLKNLGIVMTQANLQNFATSKGIRKKIDDMKEEEKVQLRYQFVLAKTKNAQGDFERTGGGFANQSRMTTENLKQIAASYGELILPEATKMFVLLNKGLVLIDKIPAPTKKLVLIFGAFLAVTGPILIGLGAITGAIGNIIAFAPRLMFLVSLMKKWEIGTKLVAAGQWLINAAMNANPIGLMIVGITALVGLGIILYKKWQPFRDLIDYIGKTIKNAAGSVGGFFSGGSEKKPIPVAESAGPIKKFDVGSTGITRTGLAIVHKGEKILPAGRNAGSTTIHFAPQITVSEGNAQNIKAEIEAAFEVCMQKFERKKARLAYGG